MPDKRSACCSLPGTPDSHKAGKPITRHHHVSENPRNALPGRPLSNGACSSEAARTRESRGRTRPEPRHEAVRDSGYCWTGQPLSWLRSDACTFPCRPRGRLGPRPTKPVFFWRCKKRHLRSAPSRDRATVPPSISIGSCHLGLCPHRPERRSGACHAVRRIRSVRRIWSEDHRPAQAGADEASMGETPVGSWPIPTLRRYRGIASLHDADRSRCIPFRRPCSYAPVAVRGQPSVLIRRMEISPLRP